MERTVPKEGLVYLSLQTVEFSSTLHFRIVQQRIDCANVRFITAYILV